jgi:putative ABC transport system permease protein
MSQYEGNYLLAGDLEEEFSELIGSRGLRIARCWYRKQVLRSLPAYARFSLIWRFLMFHNYLKTAWRQLLRHRAFSFINIAGLAVGMAVCILIFLWVWDELSFDRFHKNADSISRINLLARGQIWPVTAIPLGPALENDYPEIETTARYSRTAGLLAYQDKKFEESGAYADPSFLEMFSFPLLKGDPATALASPEAILITRELAEKAFGKDDPMGRHVLLDGSADLRVTGVLQDLPPNSSLRFDYLRPFEVFVRSDREPDNFGRFQIETYVQLRTSTSLNEVEEKIFGYLESHELFGDPKLKLEALIRIHLHGAFSEGDSRTIAIFTLIAIFILVMACLNFTNLSTARAAQRGREIGMRKVTGARRQDLIKQFLGESILLSMVAFAAALALVALALPAFNSLSGKGLHLGQLQDPVMFLRLLGLALGTGLLAGIYPALLLSSFSPVRILRGTHSTQARRPARLALRKVLVVFQFTVTIFLITSTLIMSSQLHFIFNVDLGMDREHVIYLPLRGSAGGQYQALKSELQSDPRILQVTASDQLPMEIAHTHSGFEWEGKEPEDEAEFQRASVDFDYFATLGMEILEGRGFSPEYATDATQAYVLNEAAVRRIEMESPLGKRFAAPAHDGLREGQIIGVVRDFHFQPLQTEIRPLILLIEPQRYGHVFLRISPDGGDLSSLVGYLENVWDRYSPEFPFTYRFLDESFGRMYRGEQRTGSVFRYFSLLAILVSCLGLFGLTAQVSQLRTKEIGVRKVLGASVPEITRLLSWEFLRGVIFANLIAWPAAYFAMSSWLDNFAYHAEISLWMFPAAATLAFLTALVTVSFQTIRAAVTDPVDSLRYE